jgi:phospholipase/lecithinase/hemolysin
MPDLALTPLGRSSPPDDALRLSLFTAGFNAGLTAAMGQIEAQTGINVILADTTAYLTQVLANPGFYGITNTTDQCIASMQALLTNCQGYLFTDEIHPTTRGHQILAGSFIGLVPEPGTVWLLLPLSAAAVVARRRRWARQR